MNLLNLKPLLIILLALVLSVGPINFHVFRHLDCEGASLWLTPPVSVTLVRRTQVRVTLSESVNSHFIAMSERTAEWLNGFATQKNGLAALPL
jgi:hypothetical protein